MDRFERRGLLDLTRQSDEVLAEMVRGFQQRHRDALRQIGSALRETEKRTETVTEGSGLHVMQRWYRYALAFAAYCSGDFETAHDELERVRESAARAAGRHGFLKPIAAVAVDLELLRARMARDSRRWRDMDDRIRTGRGMMLGDVPLLTLPSGEVLDFPRLEREFPRERRFGLAELLDPGSRIRVFDRYAASLYALPGWILEG